MRRPAVPLCRPEDGGQGQGVLGSLLPPSPSPLLQAAGRGCLAASWRAPRHQPANGLGKSASSMGRPTSVEAPLSTRCGSSRLPTASSCKGSPALQGGRAAGLEGAGQAAGDTHHQGSKQCFCAGRRPWTAQRGGSWSPQQVVGLALKQECVQASCWSPAHCALQGSPCG